MLTPGLSTCPAVIRLSAAVALTLLGACNGPSGSRGSGGPPPVVVEMAEVERRPMRDLVDLVGQLEAEESVLIKAETAGTIDSVEFKEGEPVRRGELLFRLRDDEQKAALREAEAALELARADFERAETLRSGQTISEAELDRARATWQRAAATRDLARVNLDRTEIRAPFDGVAGVRLVAPGDGVDRETGLVRIEAIDKLRLVFSIPEIGIELANLGASVDIEVAPLPGRVFSGEVYFVAPSVDPSTRRLLLKAWIPNAARELRPGLFANIRVEIARHEAALTVPETAVGYDTRGPHVWRVGAEGIAERVAIEIGIRDSGRVETAGEGLSEGDRVVTAGTHKLHEGAVVRAAGVLPAVASPPVRGEPPPS